MRDILVHLDGSRSCEQRIQAAVSLSRRFDRARVLGLFAQCLAEPPSLAWPPPSQSLAEIARATETLFRERMHAARLPYAWRRRMRSRHAQVIDELVVAARVFDLTILSPDDPECESQELPDYLAEQVVMQGGRPVLVIPSAGPSATIGDRVLVAWNGGREGARALADAIPIMQRSSRVTLLVIGGLQPRHFDTSGSEDLQDLLDHLLSHGIAAETEQFGSEEVGVIDMLLSRAAELGCDLLVMGAQGQDGYAGQRRGGGTRYLLSQLTLPVLLSA